MAVKELYQIKKSSGKGRKIKGSHPRKIRSLEVFNDFPEIKPVQNIMPDSKEEYWVALALYKLRLDFVFQRQVMGGRAVRGGQVVDFWVYTVPKPSILLVQGDYWHYNALNKYETLLKIAYLQGNYIGEINGVYELLTSDMPTPDTAYQLVRRELRV